jgi:hypothetical protein
MEKTGNLRLDTSDLDITVTERVTDTGKVYYEAKDQHGNVEQASTAYRAETFVRAKVDVKR